MLNTFMPIYVSGRQFTTYGLTKLYLEALSTPLSSLQIQNSKTHWLAMSYRKALKTSPRPDGCIKYWFSEIFVSRVK